MEEVGQDVKGGGSEKICLETDETGASLER